MPRLTVLIVCLLLSAAAAFAQSAVALLDKTKSLLTPDKDFFARISVSDEKLPAAQNRNPVAEYDYFRSDARAARLLYQTRPSFLTGFAYLAKAGALQGFNPDCGCASQIDGNVMRARAGFSFAELDTLGLAVRARSDSAAAGRVRDRAVIVFALAADAVADNGFSTFLSIAADSGLPLSLEYRNARGETRRLVEYAGYFEIGGKYFPRLMEIADAGEGARLTVAASGVSYNPIPEFVFTKAYLEELSR